MENEVKEIIGTLMSFGIIDCAEVARDKNYLPWLVGFFVQSRNTARELFGF